MKFSRLRPVTAEFGDGAECCAMRYVVELLHTKTVEFGITTVLDFQWSCCLMLSSLFERNGASPF